MAHLGVNDFAAVMAAGNGYARGLSAPKVETFEIGHGERGTRQTLEKMRDLVLGKEGAHHPEVRLLAEEIISHVPSKEYEQEARAIFEFMRKHVRYTLDPRGLERLASPWWTLLVTGQGDCDEHATSSAALAVALGHGAGFRTVKGDRDRPDEWSHVYGVIGISKGGRELWFPVDSTEKRARFGEDPPGASRFPQKTWVIVPA